MQTGDVSGAAATPVERGILQAPSVAYKQSTVRNPALANLPSGHIWHLAVAVQSPTLSFQFANWLRPYTERSLRPSQTDPQSHPLSTNMPFSGPRSAEKLLFLYSLVFNAKVARERGFWTNLKPPYPATESPEKVQL
jgi:hypothetical protein